MLHTGSGSPSQTPGIRRTGSISPVPEPKKSTFATVFLSLVLLGIIGYGGYKVRPFPQEFLPRGQALRGWVGRKPGAPPPAATRSPPDSTEPETASLHSACGPTGVR